jgi:hypothetical protein
VTSFEKLGAFYLGRPFDPAGARTSPAPLLYDAKDLTTHGLIVGMTGSGKTGLAIVLLEEAALDGIPSIVIDPKGDMANLALRFPDLSPEDFLPWVEPRDALSRGVTAEDLARETAEAWEKGIGEWGQSKDRLRALAAAGAVDVYTPGSAAGRPLAVLRGLSAPPASVLRDEDALRERIVNAVSGLLGLVGIEADPVASREHVLLATLLDRAWRGGDDVTLESLLKAIQSPPFPTLGALDLESFYPEKDRFSLAARLNSLLASPAFASWREGEPLDVQRLLYGIDGRPRTAILSIAHLGDDARMFFVTLLLNEVIGWMRAQEGTGSLRAILYMDEIFGFFPPVAVPPSKAPMLTLLKQARAFGLGVVLATQNPVDLDYKGLANIGTWFLGRLQTERDRDRLLEGLASASGGFDRKKIEGILSSLGKRVFLMQNVHEDGPVVFQTRWALSYLRGPLTLEQLKKLGGSSPGPAASPPRPFEEEPGNESAPAGGGERPSLPSSIAEHFLGSEGAVYRPALLATASVHYVAASQGLDHWENASWLVPLEGEDGGPDWRKGAEAASPGASEPDPGVGFGELPPAAARPKSYAAWEKSLKDHLYRERRLTLFESKPLRMTSRPGESEADFRARLSHRLREKRDEEREALGKRFAPELARVEDAIRRAEARVERESSQFQGRALDTAVDFGLTLAGALFGRKLASATNVQRATRTARSASRTSRERGDVARAEEELAEQKEKLARLEAELAEKTAALAAPAEVEIQTLSFAPRKSDIRVERLALAWRRGT